MKRFFAITAAVTAALVGTAAGQVFTQAAGAVEGPAQPGTGQALYGSFGLNSSEDPEYQIYRKYNRRETDEPLSSATNVDGNPGEAEWINVNQRQGGDFAGQESHVLTAPGMFIGQRNHTTEDGWVVSNPDQLLYLKPLIDNLNGVATDDTNMNAFWDTRFGFMENPDAYVEIMEDDPNSGRMDLWTGEFGTDAVYVQTHHNRNNADEANPDQVLSRTGHAGSFKLHAEESVFDNETGRQNQETARRRVASGDEVSRTGFAGNGVPYEDAMEVSWGMRLADPEATDEIPAREVEFWIKTGNIITSGVFDPGGGENGEFPEFSPNMDQVDFSDLMFEWQEAVPVFFAGAQGGAQGTGRMGIFTPGDFGADGAVDATDFDRLAMNFNVEDTTYSRGDFTQDGITNMDDATAWADLASDSVKTEIVAAIEADVAGGGNMYDFDGSGGTDAADVSMISELFGVGGCTPGIGDFDGSGVVDVRDFLVLSRNFNMEGTAATGDADCSGVVDVRDFLVLSRNFNQTVGEAASVPEPGSMTLVLLGLASFGVVRRRA